MGGCHTPTKEGQLTPTSDSTFDLKNAAAKSALGFIEDGMRLGLGTGSTVSVFVERLAERVRTGLRIVGVPTSQRTADQARSLGIPLEELTAIAPLDLAIDGCDEADARLNLIKGGGGALVREKIVAASARRVVIIADESKLVTRLGSFPLPVEVVPFGHVTTARRICDAVSRIGYNDVWPTLRKERGEIARSDNGNVIYDCPFGVIEDADSLSAVLSGITGVVEHGLFLDLASELVVSGAAGVRLIQRQTERR